jgi:protein-disulfide isomerase
MSRYLPLSAAALLVLSLTGAGQAPAKKSALDKAALEFYARHVWAIGGELKITVLDPKPSADLPGFQDVIVRVSSPAASQDLKIFVSNDGAKIIQGSVYDINVNPFKKDYARLKPQGSPSFGTPGATVVIVGFSDMQCPHCKDEAKMLRENLLKAYPTQVRFYFKSLPLDSIHTWARPAAIAGQCVFHENAEAFWNYHDWVFDQQENLSKENLKDKVLEWAKGQKDLDGLRLGRCIDSRGTEKEIDAVVAEAKDLKVDATPTLFVNGRRVSHTDWDSLKQLIDAELAYQAVAKDAGEDCNCSTELPAPLGPTAPAARKASPAEPNTAPAAPKKK